MKPPPRNNSFLNQRRLFFFNSALLEVSLGLILINSSTVKIVSSPRGLDSQGSVVAHHHLGRGPCCSQFCFSFLKMYSLSIAYSPRFLQLRKANSLPPISKRRKWSLQNVKLHLKNSKVWSPWRTLCGLCLGPLLHVPMPLLDPRTVHAGLYSSVYPSLLLHWTVTLKQRLSLIRFVFLGPRAEPHASGV